MKYPVPPLSLRHLSLFPLLLLLPAAAEAAPSPEDIARQQEQRQRQREEQLREHMQPAGHVRQEERDILFMKNQIEWGNDDQDKMFLW